MGTWKGYALVRDKNGKPKFDNINNIHGGYWELLTQPERDAIIEERKKDKK